MDWLYDTRNSAESPPAEISLFPWGDEPSLWTDVLKMVLHLISRNGFRSENAAVVVMGAGEGIGRALSLKLASGGYTVFACLPHDIPTPRGTSSSSTITPLLYTWQSRKARHADSVDEPGTIVPLVFDASHADDCDRAKDTIRAYCTQHNVTLRTLLVPPIDTTRPEYSSGAVSPALSSLSSGTLLKHRRSVQPNTQLLQTTQTTMHEAMSKCIFQPLGMVQALASMLHEARSQVLFISGCDETSFRSSQGVNALCDAARDRTARTLQSELGPLGIQVSHVMVGPLQKKVAQLASTQHYVASRKLFAVLSLMWAIDEHTCYKLVKSVIETRYPRSSYRFGMDVIVQDIAAAYLPSNVLDIFKQALPKALQDFT